MTLATDIEDIREGIRTGRYSNEASISQGVILRLLQALGWPTYDTRVMAPEYALSGRRVDYALCHPPTKPVAFVEVKNIGQSDGAERQLFEYAFHVGIPLAILTDGQEWNFFLPGEQGDYGERRVYKLDIVERDLSESEKRLERYLSYPRVCAGAALEAAREDYRNVSRSRQINSTMPVAWSKLVKDEDELLLELIADKVESLCGFKPDVNDVAQFLHNNVLLQSNGAPTSIAAKFTMSIEPDANQKLGGVINRASAPRILHAVGFSLSGQFVPCRNGREVLIGVFEVLSQHDSTFLERFASRPKHGRTRRYLARSREALYPGRLDLAAEHSHELKSRGWFVGTNVSHAQIKHIVEMACEVAKLHFGQDLTINIGE